MNIDKTIRALRRVILDKNKVTAEFMDQKGVSHGVVLERYLRGWRPHIRVLVDGVTYHDTDYEPTDLLAQLLDRVEKQEMEKQSEAREDHVNETRHLADWLFDGEGEMKI